MVNISSISYFFTLFDSFYSFLLSTFSSISSDQIVEIIDLIEKDKINIHIARIVLQELYDNPGLFPEQVNKIFKISLTHF